MGRPFILSYVAKADRHVVARSVQAPPIFVQTKRGGTTANHPTRDADVRPGKGPRSNSRKQHRGGSTPHSPPSGTSAPGQPVVSASTSGSSRSSSSDSQHYDETQDAGPSRRRQSTHRDPKRRRQQHVEPSWHGEPPPRARQGQSGVPHFDPKQIDVAFSQIIRRLEGLEKKVEGLHVVVHQACTLPEARPQAKQDAYHQVRKESLDEEEAAWGRARADEIAAGVACLTALHQGVGQQREDVSRDALILASFTHGGQHFGAKLSQT